MYRSDISYEGDKTDPDILYYNATIINDNNTVPNGLGQDPPVRFIETRSTALIKDISKFDFSIIRFTLNGANKNLPLFIPSVQLGQTDINLTNYSIGSTLPSGTSYTYGGQTVSLSNAYAYCYIPFVSPSANAYSTYKVNKPNSPTTSQDIRGSYYYVYEYQQWLDMINTEVTSLFNTTVAPNTYFPLGTLPYQYGNAWSAVAPSEQTVSTYSNLPSTSTSGTYYRTADTGFFYVSTGNGAPSSFTLQSTLTTATLIADSNFKPPQLQYSPSTGLFSMAIYTNYLSSSSNLMKLYFNTNMWGLFSSFNSQFLGTESNGQAYQLTFSPYIGQTAITGATSMYLYTQEYNTTSTLWCPIESIVFTSTLIPIYSEQVGAPINYGDGNDTGANNSVNNFQPIVTDIALPINTANDYRDFIAYLPSAEYRMASFTSSKQPLNSIDIQVFWKARLNNQFYPLTMFNESSVSIKMMFRKKSQYKNKGE